MFANAVHFAHLNALYWFRHKVKMVSINDSAVLLDIKIQPKLRKCVAGEYLSKFQQYLLLSASPLLDLPVLWFWRVCIFM